MRVRLVLLVLAPLLVACRGGAKAHRAAQSGPEAQAGTGATGPATPPSTSPAARPTPRPLAGRIEYYKISDG